MWIKDLGYKSAALSISILVTTEGEACLSKCWQRCVIFAGLSFPTVHGALGILRNTLSYMGRNLRALGTMCGFQWCSQLRELLSRCWITHCQQVYVLFKCFGPISNWTADFQNMLLIFWNSFEHAWLMLEHQLSVGHCRCWHKLSKDSQALRRTHNGVLITEIPCIVSSLWNLWPHNLHRISSYLSSGCTGINDQRALQSYAPAI